MLRSFERELRRRWAAAKHRDQHRKPTADGRRMIGRQHDDTGGHANRKPHAMTSNRVHSQSLLAQLERFEPEFVTFEFTNRRVRAHHWLRSFFDCASNSVVLMVSFSWERHIDFVFSATGPVSVERHFGIPEIHRRLVDAVISEIPALKCAGH